MTRALGAALLMLCACGGKPPLPSDFMWGASIAGFQVDMGCPTLPAAECEDRGSDWYQLITNPRGFMAVQSSVTFQPPTHGPGHWELWEQDFDRAKNDLALDSFRLSLEWSRIFPTSTEGITGYDALKAHASQAALERYHAMFAGLKARGVKPLVTLNHYSLPLWIHDALACHTDLDTCTNKGWLDPPRIQAEIAKYAGFVAKEFGGEVDLWATENEPFAVVLPGYIFPSSERVNPPALSYKFAEAKVAMTAMIVAHARMYDAVKENDTVDADADGKPAQVGLVYATVPMRPKDPAKPLDKKAAENVFYLYNTVFLDGVCKGDLDAELSGKAVHRDDLANRMDWIGINYYTPLTITGTMTASFPTLSPLSNFDPFALMGSTWVDDPKGLYEMAMHLKDRYGLPLIVTENGTAVEGLDDAEKASSFLVRHVTWLQRAARDGADVRGYFYWTLIDNYEWNHGMDIRMGLWAVDPMDVTKARAKRPAVDAYRQIIDANQVPAALDQQWPSPE
ncbi:MAG: glycoside hydrolase family 1 protein [Myxococcaceae bacterium]|nr:glycoside hydrolase family 1 protein [Myxococcaceae bacterium]